MKSIDHIGIAVNNLNQAVEVYKDILGFEYLGEEIVEDQGVRIAKFNCNGIHLEFLEPISNDSPIKKFLETKGQGIHHIAYKCDNIIQQIELLKQKGIKMINDSPKEGSNNTQIAFLHPKSTIILTELIQGG
ncbi:Methylmalonyl-CoA epimerase [Desulfurella amilsii]|uniref:Methylmalonyl-CoA epimerase n=1 Tax=Desulfurella amilsii TaxID=1562698 RepID=A0A1X4XWP7_9BACT|nr:methylmalonyl-CoA epimerase [Desulfurella amilsii]OSS41957.1 Methylmalonyl-CoA epimerase [Desulfurella amilsii]